MSAHPRPYAWTDKRVEMLRRLVDKGLPASAISPEMPADEYGTYVSRNSIIGKMKRLGIRSQSADAQAKERGAKQYVPRPRQSYGPRPTPDIIWARSLKSGARLLPHKIEPLPPDPEVLLEPLRVTLMELAHNGCKWPLGNPRDESFRYCGLTSEPARPYCAAHWRISRIPTGEQKRIRQKWLTERGLWKVEASA